MTRVLYVASDSDDYLGDSLFHGLREVLGADAVDAPRRDALYRDHPDAWRGEHYGRGFTLYGGLLDDDPTIKRFNTREALADGAFDLLVVGDVWRCFGTFAELLRIVPPTTRIAVLDGVDSPAAYPYEPTWWRRRYYWFLPRAHRRATYFKRELQPLTRWFTSYLTVVPTIARRLPPPRGFEEISFGIPAARVVDELPAKTQDFPAHCVDAELAPRIGAHTSYAFADEAAYYADLRASRFGITTKRGGWDCLRHYELAASGCVLCFRDLDAKPAGCAPHGLDRTNALVYRDADDLLAQVAALSRERERELAEAALAWARTMTTAQVARRFLAALDLLPAGR